ncbi:hypothetical protein BDZ91DRAFT_730961 [Kalaharituber pfeilii]|nr:hypothetical protein BDZ91DRAFT_730961 [Kalaharituber pfeilii]
MTLALLDSWVRVTSLRIIPVARSVVRGSTTEDLSSLASPFALKAAACLFCSSALSCPASILRRSTSAAFFSSIVFIFVGPAGSPLGRPLWMPFLTGSAVGAEIDIGPEMLPFPPVWPIALVFGLLPLTSCGSFVNAHPLSNPDRVITMGAPMILPKTYPLFLSCPFPELETFPLLLLLLLSISLGRGVNTGDPFGEEAPIDRIPALSAPSVGDVESNLLVVMLLLVDAEYARRGKSCNTLNKINSVTTSGKTLTATFPSPRAWGKLPAHQAPYAKVIKNNP